MRVLLILLLHIALAGAVRAQDTQVLRSDSLARIDGEDFLIHTVGQRQTLFSIAKAYGMTLSRLVFCNPGIIEGIHPGQYIRIPKVYLDEVLKDKAAEPLRTDGEYILYQVPAKQTLYAIAKEHGITVTAIQEANPELEQGLKVGSTIRIPVQRLMPKEQTGREELKGMPQYEAPSKQELPRPIAERKDAGVYHVSLLLPFFLSENDSVLNSDGVNAPEIFKRSQMALHFYEGLMMALDSVRSTGLDVRLRVFDSANSADQMARITSGGKLSGSDLIIGPFYSAEFQKAVAYAQEQRIPIVTPTMQGRQIIEGNAMVMKVLPSEEQMMVALGRHLSRLKGTNNLVLHYGKPEQQVLLWRLRGGMVSSADGQRPSFPAIDISKSVRDSVFHRLSQTRPNHLVILTADEARVASLVRSLSSWSKDLDLTVYGLSDWPKFRNVEADHWDRLKLHVTDALAIDYADVATERFILGFRKRFGTEPNTFAYRGYDLGIHFLRALPGIRAEGIDHILRVKDRGLQCDFDWKRQDGGGLENTASRIVDYTGLMETYERP
ncbi:MAG: LysM peptidoglycan-binding domain-containing protein [Flavobacteriales bacterium]|nr:LysM peptidoglycan-binding domain-containing protein [Flavobacteriales bacterium]